MKKRFVGCLLWMVVLCLLFSGCDRLTQTDDPTPSAPSLSAVTTTASSAPTTTVNTPSHTEAVTTTPTTNGAADESLSDLPRYDGAAYVAVGDNQPQFADKTTVSYERYSELDALGRCGVAEACVGKDLMPTEDRGSIGSVKPSGWHTVKYDIVDGKYLYNRCHLIGYQLTGENANKKNLITGTRYLNIEGMLPFENMVAAYVKETGNHVMYRVTPVYQNSTDLVAHGVRMEGWSVEDDGDGICFDVYCFNVQPGITIRYADGTSSLSGDGAVATTVVTTTTKKPTSATVAVTVVYVLNTNTKKIHRQSCRYVSQIKDENYATSADSIGALEGRGYACCKVCF